MMYSITTRYIWYLAIVIRVILIVYGEWQDEYMVVKYTDIDYQVYTDGARFILQHQSPYDRDTYRYTPLLAIILTPNVLVHRVFGKCLFVTCDLLVAWLLCCMLPDKHSHYVGWWLLNPLVFAVSTRGSCDSLITTLVMMVLYYVGGGNWAYGGLVYGVAVHMKLYPVIYAPSIVLYMYHRHRTIKSVVVFLVYTIVSGGVLSLLSIWWYGYDYLHHAVMYHWSRYDHRHNFSPFFLFAYLTDNNTRTTSMFGTPLMTFLPQACVLGLVAVKLSRSLPLCMCVQTMVFVTFNKVITAQYFVWYWALLPLVLPSLSLSRRHGVWMLGAWWLAEVHWLSWAYTWEFEGRSTLVMVWAAALIFFIINISIILVIICRSPVALPNTVWGCNTNKHD